MMKLNKYIILLFSTMLVFSCAKEDADVYDVDPLGEQGSDFEMLTLFSNNTNVTLLKTEDGQTGEIAFNIAFAGEPKASAMQYSYEIVGGAVDGITYAGSGQIDAGKLISDELLTIDLDQFEVCSPNDIEIRLVSGDLDISKSNLGIRYTVAGASDLNASGTYNSRTTATSTDVCCPDPVSTDGVVTITKDGDIYTVSDFSAGVYFEWYAEYGITEAMETNGALSGTFKEVCSTFAGTFSEPFGTDVELTGSIDLETGIITYSWVNGYDDQGTVILTPQ